MGGAGVGALGDIFSGYAKANTLDAQASLQLQNAQEAEAAGQYDATKEQMQAGQKLGAITAGFAAGGVSTTSGSAADVIGASAAAAELDRLNILHGADLRAINYQNQAALNQYSATQARASGPLGGAGMLMQGFAKFGGQLFSGGSGGDAADQGTGVFSSAGAGEGTGLIDAAAVA